MSIEAFFPAMKKITASEYAGPCPFCGDGGAGSDRFRLWTDSQRGGGRYWCRQCGAKGDGIDLLRKAHGMTFQQACSALGIQPKASNRPDWNGSIPRPVAAIATPSPAKAKTLIHGEGTYPSEKWMAAAARFLDQCQKGMRPDDVPAVPFGAVMAFQVKRGISPFWCDELGFGYNATDRWEYATEWGLPADANPSGKIRLPRGVVIAVRRPVGIVSLVVRLDNPEDGCRFREIRGGAKGVGFIAGDKGKPLFLLESALDAVVLAECAGDIATGLAMCGNTKGIDGIAAEYIRTAPAVFICPDRDAAGMAGISTWGEVLKEIGGIRAKVAAPCGKPDKEGNPVKDLGDQHLASIDRTRKAASVRLWCEKWIGQAI